MLVSLPAPSVLPAHREQDYSPAFQNMMNRVVAKIYRHRANKKIVVANIVHPALAQDEAALRNSAILQKTYRKNSPNPAKFFSLPRNSTQGEWHPDRKNHSTPRFTPRQPNPLQLKRTRCLTEPTSSLGVSISQKISEYNQCLMTKTVKLQEKDKLAVCLENIRVSERLPLPLPVPVTERETLTSIKKCENFKKYKKWVGSRKKIMQNSEVAVRELDFKPWETNYEELDH
jgi:hypothetical protein